MRYTLLFSIAGVGAGFLVGFAAVCMLATQQPMSDAAPMGVFMGLALAGAGAIAGAIIGGVTDLLAFFKRKDRDSIETRDRNQ